MKVNFKGMQNYRGQSFRGGYRKNYRNDNFERGTSRSRERQYSGNFRRNDRSSSSRSRSGLRASTNRDRIRCLNVGNMIILLKTVQTHREKARASTANV